MIVLASGPGCASSTKIGAKIRLCTTSERSGCRASCEGCSGRRILPQQPTLFSYTIPFNTRRSSTPGLPRDFRKNGLNRSICSPVIQKCRIITPLRFGRLNHAAREPSSWFMGPDPNLPTIEYADRCHRKYKQRRDPYLDRMHPGNANKNGNRLRGNQYTNIATGRRGEDKCLEEES